MTEKDQRGGERKWTNRISNIVLWPFARRDPRFGGRSRFVLRFVVVCPPLCVQSWTESLGLLVRSRAPSEPTSPAALAAVLYRISTALTKRSNVIPTLCLHALCAGCAPLRHCLRRQSCMWLFVTWRSCHQHKLNTTSQALQMCLVLLHLCSTYCFMRHLPSCYNFVLQ